MKIVDGFIFYNELDMLEYRLSVLNEIVDYFVIVEMTHTFTGNPKPMFFYENQHRFQKFNHKIIYVKKEALYTYPNIDFNKSHQWMNEYIQREAITEGIDTILLNPNDVIIISDVDEIPNPEVLKKIKEGKKLLQRNLFYALIQDFYYYNLKCRFENKWYNSRIFTYQFYTEHVKNNTNKYMLTNIRFGDCYNAIENAGWHLSFFGDPYFIQNKLKQFSHQEFNDKERTDINNIILCLNQNINIIKKNRINVVPLEKNKNLPIKYKEFDKLFY